MADARVDLELGPPLTQKGIASIRAMNRDSSTSALQQMQAVRLFAAMAPEALPLVLEHGEICHVPPGAELAREGDTDRDFWVLLEGELIVSVELADGSGKLDVGAVRSGGSFGEMAALLGDRRTASVTAARPSRLLRLGPAALQALFANCPGFGWAFSAELARSLKTALARKNELQADADPETVVLDVPAMDRMREYMATYYASALRTVLRQHRLTVDREFPHYEAPLRLSHDEQARWYALFGVTPDSPRPPPFTFHTTVGTLVMMKVVADVGVNFRNLLHLRSEMEIAPRDIVPGAEYRLRARLADVLALRDDRVTLVVESRVHDAEGQLVRSFRDYFVILNVEPQQVQALRAHKGFGRLPAPTARDTVRRQSKLSGLAGARRRAVDVSADMGLRYGKVSGDLNLVHTTPLAARVFGHPRPFVQGLCTANQVLAVLADDAPEPLQRFAVAFTHPVFTGQRVEILMGEGEFEVIDGKARVLAFGNFMRQAAAAGAGSSLRRATAAPPAP